jgi:hypothetical protein
MKITPYLKHLRTAHVVAGTTLGLLAANSAHAQLTPDLINQIKNTAGNRVEAAVILGGDYGLNGGSYSTGNNADFTISKFGGMGDVGDPKPLGNTGIGWQPRLQGSMGTLEARRQFTSSTPALYSDVNEYDTFAIQFGGGARFWFTDKLSLAPTIMGMYGHTENSYTAHSYTGQQAVQAGLVNWNTDTWTVRPATELSYILTWKRVIITLSSAGTYFHTESFNESTPLISIGGDSEVWCNKVDVDVPLGWQIGNHELRTGGYFSRSEFYGNLRNGLNTDYMYEVHGRVVLDFLGQLWKVQWLGVGVSYLWGEHITGVSFGADVAFRF